MTWEFTDGKFRLNVFDPIYWHWERFQFDTEEQLELFLQGI